LNAVEKYSSFYAFRKIVTVNLLFCDLYIQFAEYLCDFLICPWLQVVEGCLLLVIFFTGSSVIVVFLKRYVSEMTAIQLLRYSYLKYYCQRFDVVYRGEWEKDDLLQHMLLKHCNTENYM